MLATAADASVATCSRGRMRRQWRSDPLCATGLSRAERFRISLPSCKVHLVARRVARRLGSDQAATNGDDG
jgi:hypothetical protein